MVYEAKVLADDIGIVKKESLAGLTSEEWGAWVQDQIHGRGKVMVSGEKGDYSATSLFEGLIPDLEASERFKAYGGIAQCLDRAYEGRRKGNSSSDWNDVPLDDLLSLVGWVETNLEGTDCRHQDTYFAERSDTITRFLDVVEPEPSFKWSGENRDLYFRVLQALCGARAKLPYEFWAKHLGQSPNVYGFVCFDGAANNSPYDGINLLPHIDWSDEESRGRMHGSLLGFYHDYYGDTKVIEKIERRKQELPEEAQKVFNEAKKDADELAEGDKGRRKFSNILGYFR